MKYDLEVQPTSDEPNIVRDMMSGLSPDELGDTLAQFLEDLTPGSYALTLAISEE